ncbi:MAG: hypothetical protein AAF213_05355 [Pseudomonadota bacterium]
MTTTVLDQAFQHLAAEQHQAAIPLFEDVAINPPNQEAGLKAKRALAIVYLQLGDIDRTIAYADEVLHEFPQDLNARFILISAYSNKLDYPAAYRVAQSLGEPGAVTVPVSMLHAYCQATVMQGDYQRFDAVGDFLALLDQLPADKLPNFLAIQPMRNRVFSDESVSRYLALQQKWGQAMMEKAAADPLPEASRALGAQNRNRDGRRRLVFYALSDIFDTQLVLRPILEHIDRTIFEPCLAFIENGAGVQADDGFTALFEQVSVIPRGTDREVARHLAELGCDIMIDLNGLQQPATRVGALAWRPAPVQLSWTGRPITCGLPALDYNIVDEVLAADGTGCLNATLNLPGAFACFGPMPDFDIVPVPPSKTAGYVSLGINAEPAKFNRHTIAMWADSFHQVASATGASPRLIFMRPEYASDTLRTNILAEFSAHNVPAEQIAFWHEPAPNREYMKRYNHIDILLDCYPMTGGIGMLEALHMGVPAVSVKGPAIQLRAGSSHLTAVGLNDLITTDPSEYPRLVARLATDETRRERLRQALRPRLTKAAFVDVRRFAEDFNGALKQLVDHPALQARETTSKEDRVMSNDQTITINDKEYRVADLSEDALAQVRNLQAVDQELARLQSQAAIAQTARAAYLNALNQALPEAADNSAAATAAALN